MLYSLKFHLSLPPPPLSLCVCVCVSGTLGVFLNHSILFLRQGLSVNLEPPRLLDLLASEPQGCSCFFLLSIGISGMCHHASLFKLLLGIRTWILMCAQQASYQLNHLLSFPAAFFCHDINNHVIETVVQPHWESETASGQGFASFFFPICGYIAHTLKFTYHICEIQLLLISSESGHHESNPLSSNLNQPCK